MVNIDDFVQRLQKVLDYYNLTASSFADKIGVQRSSLSHLLSGRNKPSLDFILKIIEVFPEVDLYWILNGTGSFPKSELSPEAFSAIEKKEPAPTPITENKPTSTHGSITMDLFAEEILTTENSNESRLSEEKKEPSVSAISVLENTAEVERIVIFFKNGKFKTYFPD